MLKPELKSLLLVVASCLCFGAQAVETPITIEELLPKLESAERKLSFRGHFTHEHGGTIETFEILRLVIEDIEYEKVTRLSGPAREKVKIGRDIRCLTKSNHLLRGHHLNLKLGGAVSLAQSYKFFFLGEDRIAGRNALVLRIEPRDSFRHGYWLSVDKASGLVVRSIITSGKKKALERAQYVSVEELDESTNFAEMISAAELDTIQQRAALKADGSSSCDFNVSVTSPWRPSWVPEGFLLTSYSLTEEDGHMETYSDGLGVFSVFISDFPQPQRQRVLAQRGATVALMSKLNLGVDQVLNVSVVGEIPLLAAQKISSSIVAANLSEP